MEWTRPAHALSFWIFSFQSHALPFLGRVEISLREIGGTIIQANQKHNDPLGLGAEESKLLMSFMGKVLNQSEYMLLRSNLPPHIISLLHTDESPDINWLNILERIPFVGWFVRELFGLDEMIHENVFQLFYQEEGRTQGVKEIIPGYTRQVLEKGLQWEVDIKIQVDGWRRPVEGDKYFRRRRCWPSVMVANLNTKVGMNRRVVEFIKEQEMGPTDQKLRIQIQPDEELTTRITKTYGAIEELAGFYTSEHKRLPNKQLLNRYRVMIVSKIALLGGQIKDYKK